MMSVNSIALFSAYIILLGFHFGYAYWVLETNLFSLQVGRVHSRFQILSLLLLINGVSLSVFYYSNPTWIQLNIILHLVLIGDEVIRCSKNSLRWPFLLNHVLFTGILFLFFEQYS